MKLVYSRRALTDLDDIAAYYTASASPAIASSIGRRLEDVIDRICRIPEAAPRVSQRSQVRIVAVVRYPFRIFYRVREGRIDILHIRHTSRRPLGRVVD
jgi:toxin ParE1/3/4